MNKIDPYQQLIRLIIEVTPAQYVFLLGTTEVTRTAKSIFNKETPACEEIEQYYLLVLIPHNSQETNNQTQEHIESLCQPFYPVTAMVLDTSQFIDWLKSGHPFACQVLHHAETLYKEEGVVLGDSPANNVEELTNSNQVAYVQGLNKVVEFLAGADLFRIRQQNRMAAFMLHQAVEHALLTILKMTMGVKVNTHNLDKLIRYCSMIGFEASAIFPRKTEMDKKLFQLLQRAYVESRYGQDYNISYPDLIVLSNRAAGLLELVKSHQQSINRLSGSKK